MPSRRRMLLSTKVVVDDREKYPDYIQNRPINYMNNYKVYTVSPNTLFQAGQHIIFEFKYHIKMKAYNSSHAAQVKIGLGPAFNYACPYSDQTQQSTTEFFEYYGEYSNQYYVSTTMNGYGDWTSVIFDGNWGYVGDGSVLEFYDVYVTFLD